MTMTSAKAIRQPMRSMDTSAAGAPPTGRWTAPRVAVDLLRSRRDRVKAKRGRRSPAAAGRPLDDQANHLPIAYEKDKVRRLFRKYRLLKQPLVDNLLYSNEFATHPPRHCRAILYRETGKPPADEIRRRLNSALIVNHVDESFTPAMEQVLSELFPDPCSVERP